MDAAAVSLERLREGYLKHKQGEEFVSNEEIEDYETRFHEAINDDLNMPVAMSIVWEVVKANKKSKRLAELLKQFDTVMGLNIEENKQEKKTEEIPQEIKDILEQRKQARESKAWKTSDALRDRLKELGFSVRDSKDGQTVEKI